MFFLDKNTFLLVTLAVGGMFVAIFFLLLSQLPYTFNNYDIEPEDFVALLILSGLFGFVGFALLFIGVSNLSKAGSTASKVVKIVNYFAAIISLFLILLGLINYDTSDKILLIFCLPLILLIILHFKISSH